MKLHGEEVKVGDRVWHVRRGWGEVTEVDNERACFPICVRFIGCCERFTKGGKAYITDEKPTLFWQPIEFEIPKKPKKNEKAWQWIYYDYHTELYGITFWHYSSVDEFYSKTNKDRYKAIDPYLPSEIERDVKE